MQFYTHLAASKRDISFQDKYGNELRCPNIGTNTVG